MGAAERLSQTPRAPQSSDARLEQMLQVYIDIVGRVIEELAEMGLSVAVISNRANFEYPIAS